MNSFYFEKLNVNRVFFAFLAIFLFIALNQSDVYSQSELKENRPAQNPLNTNTNPLESSLPQTLDEGFASQSTGETKPTLVSLKQKSKGISILTFNFPSPYKKLKGVADKIEETLGLPKVDHLISGIGYDVPSFSYIIQGKITSVKIVSKEHLESLPLSLTFHPEEFEDIPIGNDGPKPKPVSRESRQKEFNVFPEKEISFFFGGSMRGVPISTITVSPYRYDPRKKMVTVSKTVTVEVSFDLAESDKIAIGIDEESILKSKPRKKLPYSQSISKGNIQMASPNLGEGKNRIANLPVSQIPGLSSLPVRPKAKIITDKDGIYRIGFFEFQEYLRSGSITADFFTADPRTLRLFNKGIEIPILVKGEQDGAFNRNDFIEFFGEKNALKFADSQRPDMYTDPYSDENIYYLYWEPSLNNTNRGLRLVEIPVEVRNPVARGFNLATQTFRSNLHFEEDLGGLGGLVPSQSIEQNLSRAFARFNTTEYKRTRNESDFRDRAFWDAVFLNSQREFPIELPGLADVADDSIRIKVAYHGLSYDSRFNPQNRAVLQLGGVVVGQTNWGNGAKSQELKIDNFVTSARQFFVGVRRDYDTIKTIQVANQDDNSTVLPGEEGRSFFVNWFNISYPRTYQAFDDKISFSIPVGRAAGRYEFLITGFTTPNIQIYKRGVGILNNFTVEPYFEIIENPDGSATRIEKQVYRIRFQDNVINPNDVIYDAIPQTEKLLPLRVEKLLPSNLYEPGVRLVDKTNDYSFIIITSSKFIGEQNFNDSRNVIFQYKTYREERLAQLGERSRVLVVTAESIYDEFNYGIKSPRAIRDFLDYAYHEWRESPIYVLLIGGAFRIKNSGNLVPTMRIQTIEFGATAADAWYVMIDGTDESGKLDLLPDMQISRIAASNTGDVANYLEKLKQYEEYAVTGEWRNRVIMIAGEAGRTSFNDPNDNKIIQTDEIIRQNLGRNFFVSRINTGEGRFPSNPQLDIHLGNSETLRNLMNNDGSLVLNFIGHGGGAVWSDSQVMELGDVSRLSNTTALPFVTSMSCFTGAFDDGIGAYTLSQALTLSRRVGSIGVIASAGFGWYRNDFLMSQSVFEFLLTDQYQGLSIGDMLFRGKTRYYLQYKYTDIDIAPSMMYQYGVFGDPALRLASAGVTRSRNSLSGGANTANLKAVSSLVALNDSLRITGSIPGITEGNGFAKISDQDNFDVTVQLQPFVVRSGKIGQIVGGVFRDTLAIQITQPPTITATNVQNFKGGQFKYYIRSTAQPDGVQPSDISGRVPFILQGTAIQKVIPSLTIQEAQNKSITFSVQAESSQPIDSVRIVSEIYRPSATNLNQNTLIYTRSFSTSRSQNVFIAVDSIPAAFMNFSNRIIYYAELFRNGTRQISQVSSEFIGNPNDISAVPKARTGLIQYYDNQTIGFYMENGKPRIGADIFNWKGTEVQKALVYFYHNSVINRQTSQPPTLRTNPILLGIDTISLPAFDPTKTSGVRASIPVPDTLNLFSTLNVGIRVLADTSGMSYEESYQNNLSNQIPINYTLQTINDLTSTTISIAGDLTVKFEPSTFQLSKATVISKIVNPVKILQPDNQFVPFQSDPFNPIAFQISPSDSAEPLLKPVTLTFNIAKNVFSADRSNIYAFIYNSSFQRWLKIPDQQRLNDTTISCQVNELGQFALMHTTDLQRPIVTLGIEGQVYLPNGPAPKRPRVSATIQDQNGVFVDRRQMKVIRNGDSSEAVQGKLLIPQASFNSNTIGVVYDDEFDQGSHELIFVFNDANLNETRTEPMLFQVQTEFNLNVYGVYPNPFEEQTRIVYEISGEQAAEVLEIKIYNVAGKLINSLRNGEIGATGFILENLASTDLNSTGAKIVIWTGQDKDGAPVANGVYYIRIRATYQGRSFEQILKAAKVR
ncbi:MAG: C25 family cysteine peptidase [Chloroherpetonaceae bacterium]|nr:C25 family cysteine peptidase [Chloroherpetonaceae bacterium]